MAVYLSGSIQPQYAQPLVRVIKGKGTTTLNCYMVGPSPSVGLNAHSLSTFHESVIKRLHLSLQFALYTGLSMRPYYRFAFNSLWKDNTGAYPFIKKVGKFISLGSVYEQIATLAYDN